VQEDPVDGDQRNGTAEIQDLMLALELVEQRARHDPAIMRWRRLPHGMAGPVRPIAGRDRPPWRCQNPVGAGPPGKPHLDRIEPSAPTASRNWPRSSPDSNRDDSTWT
jgi:hypothetical protein